MGFRDDMKANNQRFKQDIKKSNEQFKKDIKQTHSSKVTRGDSTKRLNVVPNWLVISLLILFFPLGIYLVWRQERWSKRTKKITTWISSSIVLAFFALIIIFAPPTVTVTSSLASVKSDTYHLTGEVYPAGSTVTVNGGQAKVTDSTYSANVKLEEGDNTLKVVVVNGDKRTEQEFKIHRYTKDELLAQEKAMAKKAADAAAAAKNKQQQAADAKAKADADAAVAKAKADAAAAAKADADAKAKAAAAVTVSQKNALSKAKSYLVYTAFSHDGLVEQLVYEQFSLADATYGADNVGANWNEQAAKKAKSYMAYSSFSRGSLIDQLIYEKFTPDQAAYGATAVGL